MIDSSLSVRLGARRSVVGVDESTGSLEALFRFFESLPPEPDAAFVIVVSHDLTSPQALLERLSQHTRLSAAVITEPTSMRPNQIYLSPPGRQLVFRRNVIAPIEGAAPEETAVPMVYVFRQVERLSAGGDGQSGDEPSSYRLVVQPSQGPFGEETVPIAVVEPLIEGGASDAAEERAAFDPCVERLETELRETRTELRDMVQKYEATQRRLRAANRELQAANDELEGRTEQVKALSEALTRAEEEERERLSHVLHDDLQQVLFAVRTKLDLLEETLSVEGRERRLLTRAVEMLDDGLDTTRTLASDLNPPVENSLWDTLDWLAIQMQEAHGLSVEVQAEGRNLDTDTSVRRLVVRLVQELLFNVVKHAGTDEARLRVTEADDWLRVVVADEGEGFDPQEALDGAGCGFGLASVRDRVELVGGRFSVDAAPGEGARVMLEVPFEMEGGEGDRS